MIIEGGGYSLSAQYTFAGGSVGVKIWFLLNGTGPIFRHSQAPRGGGVGVNRFLLGGLLFIDSLA